MKREFFDGSNVGVRRESVNLSNVYEVIKGGFGSGNSKVTSYLTSTTVQFLKQDLITFQTLLKDSKWPVSKIIQREVDSERVREISKNYIENSSESIRYFPPIVVAILPRSGDLFSETYKEYVKNDYSKALYKIMLDRANPNLSAQDLQSILDNDSSNLSKAEGIFIKQPFKENHSYLAWDRDKYYAIVIDGQHRFEALKASSSEASSPVNTYFQDVIFIEGSSKYFADSSNNTSISIFRKIFMDINKNPVQVSDAKQIIMDDTEPAKLCVQSIVDDTETSNDSFIRPELIDWNTNSNKHELPYLTGIISLYNIISNKLFEDKRVHSLESRSDETNVKKWVSQMNDVLRVDSAITEHSLPYTPLKISFEAFTRGKVNNEDELFSFDNRVIKVAVDSFKKYYRNSFVYYFNNLYIYSSLIKKIESKGVFQSASPLRIALLKSVSNREEFEKTLIKDLKDSIESSELGASFNILFTVVGQKALFDLFYQWIDEKRNGQLDNSILYDLTKKFVDNQKGVFEFLEKLDFKLFGQNDQDFYREFRKGNSTYRELNKYGISTYFWDDLLYFDNNIKYNKVGVNAIKSIYSYISECIEKKGDINSVSPIQLTFYKNKTKGRLIEDHSKNEQDAELIASKFVKLKLDFLKHLVLTSVKG